MLYSRFLLVFCFKHSSVYMSTPISQFTPPCLSPLGYPYVCSLCLCPYFCFADKIIYTILLDSTNKHSCKIYVFLFLTYFTLYDRHQIHSYHYKWPHFVPFYGWDSHAFCSIIHNSQYMETAKFSSRMNGQRRCEIHIKCIHTHTYTI